MQGAERRAKIVATVGPATSEEKVLRRLLRAGVDVVRLNASHGSRDQHRETIERVHRVGQEQGLQVAVMLDLMGPRYRLDELAEPISLRKGQRVTLGPDRGADLPVSDPHLLAYVRPDERLLIDNGLIELRVERKVRRRLTARVLSPGVVSSRKGINLPDSDLPFAVSDKDREDLEMAVEAGADFLAASYVGSARDIEAIRKLVVAAGGDLPIVAKLERGRAVEHLEEIVGAADAVMVARGDLGVEIELHQVPVVQKRIIETGWRHGKSVIVATQMLESMMEHPRPTRAESSDVANAVFDGADALMLSGETASGRHPIESVRTMDRIIREAERHQRSRDVGPQATLAEGPYDVEPPSLPGTLDIPETISAAAVLSARQLGARRIVALTQAGFTARRLAMRRPSTPVLAFTQNVTTARRLQLVWGVRPFLMAGDVKHHDEVVGLVDRCLLEAQLAKPGDCIAILMGDPIQARPPTNLLRLHRVRG